MCIAPNTLWNNGKALEVACHECWQCRDRAISDWVGRNIAETKTAKASHAITLTYGRDEFREVLHPRALILTYSDVQKYLKLLRRHGYPVRYFVTGEFGSKNGRAHWHIMLYWQDCVPDHVLDQNFMEQHWPYGWSFWTKPTGNAVRYNCKYIQKGMAVGDDMCQGHLAMSKKPPLGTAYFRNLVDRYVEQGLAPQSLEYAFPDVRKGRHGTGEPLKFRLKDTPARMFLDYFCAQWARVHPHVAPNSKLVEEHLDRGAWKNVAPAMSAFDAVETARPRRARRFDDMADWLIAYKRENDNIDAHILDLDEIWAKEELEYYRRYLNGEE